MSVLHVFVFKLRVFQMFAIQKKFNIPLCAFDLTRNTVYHSQLHLKQKISFLTNNKQPMYYVCCKRYTILIRKILHKLQYKTITKRIIFKTLLQLAVMIGIIQHTIKNIFKQITTMSWSNYTNNYL